MKVLKYVMPFLAAMSVIRGEAQSVAMKAADYYREPEIARKVEKLLGRMTIDEKIGQLVLFAGKGVVTGATESKNIEEYIAQGMCGGVFNIRTAEEAMRLQTLAVTGSRLGIPMLFGFDVIHGFRTTFPVNIGMSASWNIPAIEHSARIAAEEASAAGVNWAFSPMCDISRDPRWGRVSEGAGEDPYLGSAVSAAMVRGYQGNDLSARNTLLACVKHFAAYGAPQAGRDYHTVDMSERTFRDVYLPPYKAGLDAGAATVMTSFNEYDGVPATANGYLLDSLLRKELGFGGFVTADYTAVMELVPHGIAVDERDAALQALTAGVNMDMVSNLYLRYARELIETGALAESRIDELCREILGMKFRLGLFDDPYRYCRPGREEVTFYKPEHLEAARCMARSSMVLLENKGILPVTGEQTIALIGPFSDAPAEMLGSWAIGGEPKRTVTFRQGLADHFGVDRIIGCEGCGFDSGSKAALAEAVAVGERADVILLTLGLPRAWSGEAASLTSIRLPDAQVELLRTLKETGKPVVVLLVTGRPLDLTRERELADAILVTWYPGTMAGAALADVVSGDYNPSGKLSMTFPRDVGQIPLFYSMKNTGRPLGRKSMSKPKFTSRYLFTPNEPLYPFGYGLSYTQFEFSDLQVLTPSVVLGDSVKIRVTVENTGSLAGEEVVQLYVQDIVGSVTRPVRELKGFQKILLTPGERRVIDFTLTPEDLSFYRRDMTFGQEEGSYNVWIGNSSDASLSGHFKLVSL